MSGFNDISKDDDTTLLGQLTALRRHLNQLVVEGCMTIPVRVRLHLALDHIDDAIAKEQQWQQNKAIEATSAAPNRRVQG